MALFRRRRGTPPTPDAPAAPAPATPRSELSFDEDPRVAQGRCDCCDGPTTTSTGLVRRDGSAFAVYWLSWYPHKREGWLDAALGTWEEPSYPWQATFGCRIGAVDGQAEPACSLVTPSRAGDAPMLGTKLSADAARAHPWLPDFWALVDWVIVNDPVAHEHLYHLGPDATP